MLPKNAPASWSAAALCRFVLRASAHDTPSRSRSWSPVHYGRWTIYLLSATLIVSNLAGCVSKTKAQAQARDAFIAGQQETFRQMQLNQSPNVNFVGPVKNPAVPWTKDLTLAQALINAGYMGRGDPRDIILIRKGVASRIDPKKLLGGEDIPLQQGDIIQVNP